MKLVTPPLAIEDLDGFKNDLLQRKPFGEALTNLVLHSTDELVISLDGKWGEGKTTFVKMWQGLLKEKGVPSIYVDAFQNDYTEDAFISIASAITSYVDSHATEAKRRSDFKDKATKIGAQLLSWTARISIKAATFGAIKESDIEDLREIGKEVATDASDAIADLVKDRLDAHMKENALIQSFRESLSEIPATLQNNTSGRLVIIIDELDRCRPSFAVEILEKIKHLFSVQNVFFLLVMNKEQLEQAIRCVYGNIEAGTYLQKFINIETILPERAVDRYSGNRSCAYSEKLLRLHELETWGDGPHILKCFSTLARHFQLSLRQLEKVFTNLVIIYSSSTKNYLRVVPIITFICVVKIVKPGIFKKLLLKQISYAELSSEIGMSMQNENDEGTFLWIMGWIRFSLLTDAEFEKLSPNDPIHEYGPSLWKYSVDRRELIPMFCQKLGMFVVH